VLSVGGSSSSSDGNPVIVYRTPLTNGQPFPVWEQFLGPVRDAANDSIPVKSFAQLFSYSDSYAIVGTKPNNNQIRTIVSVHDNNPAGAWSAGVVPTGSSFAQTGTRVAVLFYQGNPYLFYADLNANGALTAVTSAVKPLNTIPGGTQ
jgi:hypothetical protein